MNPSRCSVLLTVATTWLLACVVIAFTACGEPESSGSDARDEEVPSASEQATESQSPPKGPETIRPAWFGDLDEMVEGRRLHAVVTFSDTNYFLDGAEQKGISYEALKTVREGAQPEVREGAQRKRGTEHLKIHLVIVPVHRDRLIPALVKGRADLALANLTITPERQKRVDFSTPVFTEVSEVVVTGPGIEPVEKVEDLSGREVVVRASSSYYESLRLLNRAFRGAGDRAGHADGGGRASGGRGSPGDGQRRHDSDDGGRQLPGRVLVPGVSRNHGSVRRRRCRGGRDRLGVRKDTPKFKRVRQSTGSRRNTGRGRSRATSSSGGISAAHNGWRILSPMRHARGSIGG